MKKICIFIVGLSLILLEKNTFAQNPQKKLSAEVSWGDSTSNGVDSIVYNWTEGDEESSIFKNYPIYQETKFDALPSNYKQEELINLFKKANAYGYKWFDTSANYNLFYTTEVELNANGQVVKFTLLIPNAQNDFKPAQRTVYTYVGNNLSTYEMALTSDQGSSWENLRKATYTYEPGTDNVKQIIKESGFLSTQWKNNQKNEIAYTGNQMISETHSDWDDVNDVWDSSKRIEYTYLSNGLLDTMTELEYYTSSGSLLKQPKYRSIYNNASNGFLRYVVRQGNQSGLGNVQWRNKDSITFSGNGNYINKSTQYQWNLQSSNSQPSGQYEMTYDGPLLESVKYAEWNESLQIWEPGIYGSDAIFYYEDISETNIEYLKKDISFKLFPNPANAKITVEVNKEDFINQLQILNIAGQVVYKSKNALNASKVTLPIHQLASGMYYLKVTSGKEQGVKSFIVR